MESNSNKFVGDRKNMRMLHIITVGKPEFYATILQNVYENEVNLN